MATTGFDLSKLLGDPNFQQLLARTGAGLDPKGPAGALGGATSQMLSAQAAQKRTDLAEQNTQDFRQRFISALGGFTPPGTPGISNFSATPTGGKFDIDLSEALGVKPTTPPGEAPKPAPPAEPTPSPQASASGIERRRAQLNPFLPWVLG